jgi:hypothetical protein
MDGRMNTKEQVKLQILYLGLRKRHREVSKLQNICTVLTSMVCLFSVQFPLILVTVLQLMQIPIMLG